MNEFIILSWLERVTGIEASSWVLFAGVVVAVANIITKRIPADSTGWLARVRSVTGFIGMVMSSRVTSQTTTMDVVKSLADHGVGSGSQPVVRNEKGQIAKKKESEEGSAAKGLLVGFSVVGILWAVAVVVAMLLMSGCATDPVKFCDSAKTVQKLADATVNQCQIRGIY